MSTTDAIPFCFLGYLFEKQPSLTEIEQILKLVPIGVLELFDAYCRVHYRCSGQTALDVYANFQRLKHIYDTRCKGLKTLDQYTDAEIDACLSPEQRTQAAGFASYREFFADAVAKLYQPPTVPQHRGSPFGATAPKGSKLYEIIVSIVSWLAWSTTFLAQHVITRVTIVHQSAAFAFLAVALAMFVVVWWRNSGSFSKSLLVTFLPVLLEKCIEYYLEQDLPELASIILHLLVNYVSHTFTAASRRALLRSLALMASLFEPVMKANTMVQYAFLTKNSTVEVHVDPARLQTTVIFDSGFNALYFPLNGTKCIFEAHGIDYMIDPVEHFHGINFYATCSKPTFDTYVAVHSVKDPEINRVTTGQNTTTELKIENVTQPFFELKMILEEYGLHHHLDGILNSMPVFLQQMIHEHNEYDVQKYLEELMNYVLSFQNDEL